MLCDFWKISYFLTNKKNKTDMLLICDKLWLITSCLNNKCSLGFLPVVTFPQYLLFFIDAGSELIVVVVVVAVVHYSVGYVLLQAHVLIIDKGDPNH